MKNLLVILLFYGCSQQKPPCDPIFAPPVAYVDSVYKANGIKIDYDQVHSIRMVTDSTISNPFAAFIYDGAYGRENKIIYLNQYTKLRYPEDYRNKFLSLVYAHELAHSQGIIEHSDDKSSIMYSHTNVLDSLMAVRTIEDLILDIYK